MNIRDQLIKLPSRTAESNSRDYKRNLMLFDLKVAGHHASYIRHLVKYWCEQNQPGSLNVVVVPQFVEQHSRVVDLPKQYCSNNVQFIAISDKEAFNLKSRKSGSERAIRNLQEWKLLCKYARALNSSHCLIMFLDTFELPLILGLKPPCPVSGIYFRPTFHYHTFPNQVFSFKERVQRYREWAFLHHTLRNPKLHHLFCIDPFVSSHINSSFKTNKAIHLVDPVEVVTAKDIQIETLRKKLQISLNRRIFLLFGLLDGRKGIYKVLDTLQGMPPEKCEKICLLLVGQLDPLEREKIKSRLQELRQTQPIQIVTQFEFVPEEEVHTYFHITDFVLAPYQRHVGMSGILLLGAAAQKPVLSSNYGLMGELVRRYELGLAIDSTVCEEISKGIIQFLDTDTDRLCNKFKMKLFTEENLAAKFPETIFQAL